jgi:predicted dehydrogenase
MRVGVVGCGKIAERHLAALRKLGAEVTVSDIVERGRDVAEQYGAAWDPVPQHLIEDDFDAIDICTPTPTHASFIEHALRAGKHVFCEKPLARNVDEALRIEALAQETGRIVMVGYLYRFHPAFEFVREILDDGVIGEPYFAQLRLGGRGSHKAWKHKADTGGGAGNEVLVHMVDLALSYFGPAASVQALWSDTILPERTIEGSSVDADAEDIAILRMLTESGVHVVCESDLVTPGYMNHVEIQGTNGSVFTSILDYMPTIVFCKDAHGIYDRGHTFKNFAAVDLFEREFAHFFSAIRGEAGQVNSIADSVAVMGVVETALEAARAPDRATLRQ